MKSLFVRCYILLSLVFLAILLAPGGGSVCLAESGEPGPAAEQEDLFAEDEWDGDDSIGSPAVIADPLESLNRLFFQFNDKFYLWLLKPVSEGYAKLLARDVRVALRNGFDNLLAPVRVANNLLQGKFGGAGVETARFLVNSTIGIYGLADAARNEFSLMPHEEDLGQTLGVYGAGPGFYINWPLLGPSSLRDSLGQAGDAFVDPFTYLPGGEGGAIAASGVKRINQTSLSLGDYELFVETSLDPYAAVRDAYQQYRQGRIKDLSAE